MGTSFANVNNVKELIDKLLINLHGVFAIVNVWTRIELMTGFEKQKTMYGSTRASNAMMAVDLYEYNFIWYVLVLKF